MRNPVLIELTRGSPVESVHAGAVAVVRADGEIVAAVGDVAAPIFPRSAIKPLQAIAFVESGAADRFGLGAPEIALASASHSGTQAHAALARSMLERVGVSLGALACGVHEPLDGATARAMVRAGTTPTSLHHNCSGKHAGMLATAVHKGEPEDGYWHPDHPVQVRIAHVLEDLAGCRLSPGVCGIDGCSVPNWAMPLSGLAQAFARFGMGQGIGAARAPACRRIFEACSTHPDLVAGPGRLDTLVMTRLPGKVLIKAGAEGAYCGVLPTHGLGFALKIDDGAKRAAEAVVVQLLSRFYPQVTDLGPPAQLINWRGVEVGRMRASQPLVAMLTRLKT
jgi:L-asparaginase II